MNNANNPRRLFDEVLATAPTDTEIQELYTDLSYVFGSPFDTKINEAITMRGAVYIEMPQLLPN